MIIDPIGATLVTGPTVEPITVETLVALARLERPDELALVPGWIRAAREQVERDSGMVLLTQTWDLFFDEAPIIGARSYFRLPKVPVQSLVAFEVDGEPIDVASCVLTQDRVWRRSTASWPLVFPVQTWKLRVVAGFGDDPSDVPPLLTHCVGLLAAHWATQGRDLVITGTIVAGMQFTYDEAMDAIRREVLP